MSLPLAVAFAEKQIKKLQEENIEEPIPQYLTKLYLKLLSAKGDFDKGIAFLKGEGKRSFDMWVEHRTWQLQMFLESG